MFAKYSTRLFNFNQKREKHLIQKLNKYSFAKMLRHYFLIIYNIFTNCFNLVTNTMYTIIVIISIWKKITTLIIQKLRMLKESF